MEIKVELELGVKMPSRAHASDAGFDLAASAPATITAGLNGAVVHTGVHMLIPDGYFGLVAPRSGLTRKGLVAEIGIVDAGYTGEICVTMRYERHGLHIAGPEKRLLTTSQAVVDTGERVAQLLILPLPSVQLVEGDVTNVKTERSANGFGSTGI